MIVCESAVLIVARLSQSLLCAVGEIAKQLGQLFDTQKKKYPGLLQ